MPSSFGGTARAQPLPSPFRVDPATDSEPWFRFARGWAPLLAALVVLASTLPGLLALPPLDRDEARFAQSTAQMLETGDFIDIRFQDQARDKKPVGINWLQALSVELVSSVEKREIWAYRLPSLAGAMAAAAICAWGASGFLGRRGGALAGAVLGSSFLLGSEGFIAKTDAVLCFAVTLSMTALMRLYTAAEAGRPASRAARGLFWIGQAAAILVKGPVGPVVAGLAILALWAADRQARWATRLGWRWGLLFVALAVGPWAIAITVSTDGAFWTGAVDGDLAPKLAGGHQGHGMAPGYYLALAPLLAFPSAFALPAALSYGWRHRHAAPQRFALAWLVPSWLVFEIAPTKLAHYTLPLFPALAWLVAGALAEPLGPWSRRIGAALSLLAGAVIAATALVINLYFGDAASDAWAWLGALLCLLAGGLGAFSALRGARWRGVVATLAVGVLAHGVLSAGLAPRLSALWTSQRAALLLQRAGLDPRNGLTLGPVAVAGYAEPSLIFALGSETELDDGAQAAESLSEGQPALVEAREQAAFLAALKAMKVVADPIGTVRGFDYSDHRPVALTLWRARGAPTPPVPPPRA